MLTELTILIKESFDGNAKEIKTRSWQFHTNFVDEN